jgi:hypothetical protein
MSDVAREILIAGAGALKRTDELEATLKAILDALCEQFEVGSGAIVVVKQPSGRLAVAASFGLGAEAAAGLAHAMENPAHPIARTVATPVPTFNVLPTVPGGPVLRSHIPLTVMRSGADTILGVLALAHDRPLGEETWPVIQAGADLAAVAIERGR